MQLWCQRLLLANWLSTMGTKLRKKSEEQTPAGFSIWWLLYNANVQQPTVKMSPDLAHSHANPSLWFQDLGSKGVHEMLSDLRLKSFVLTHTAVSSKACSTCWAYIERSTLNIILHAPLNHGTHHVRWKPGGGQVMKISDNRGRVKSMAVCIPSPDIYKHFFIKLETKP